MNTNQRTKITDEPIGSIGPITEVTGADSLDGGQSLQERADIQQPAKSENLSELATQ